MNLTVACYLRENCEKCSFFVVVRLPGDKKQRWLQSVDPLLPGDVLLLAPLPGLV